MSDIDGLSRDVRPPILVRPARADECAVLSDLCLRSKAVWGYDFHFMQACREDLMLVPDDFASSAVQVAELSGRVVGVAQVTSNDDQLQLEKLFVDPADMRSGAGRILFDWARRLAAARGASALTIESDPQAAGFYRCMGAIDDGTVASTSIPGRLVPRLKLIFD